MSQSRPQLLELAPALRQPAEPVATAEIWAVLAEPPIAMALGPGAGGGVDGGAGLNGGAGGFGGGGGTSDGNGGSGGFGGGGSGYGATGGYGAGNAGGAGGGTGFGGAIFERAGSLSLTNVAFNTNDALGGSGTESGQGKGGALFIFAGASATGSNVTFSGSIAANAGAAGIGNSAAPYTTGSQCPGVDTTDVCGALTLLAGQTITFPQPPDTAVNGGPVALSGSASSGLALTYSSNSTAVCTVSGSSVTLVSIGVCSITAHQPGDSTHGAAPDVTDTFNVTNVAQTITFGSIASQTAGGSLNLSATATSGLAVTFSSLTTSVCTVSGTTATLLTTGTCTIQAMQAGNATYAAAPNVQQSFSVVGASQTITFGSIASQTAGGSLNPSATATSGLAVTYSSLTTSVCTVSGTTASFLTTGACTLQAMQAGNNVYSAAPNVQQSFSVVGSSQTITFGSIASQTAGGSLNLSATATSGLAVTFSSLTTSVCTVSGTTASLLNAGTCTLQAMQAGNATYAAAPNVQQSFQVAGGTAFITAQSPGPLRNDYNGFVGFQFTVGSTPVTVYSLGRYLAPGNTQTHVVKLVQANGINLTGGTIAISTAGGATGTYKYASLSNPITLLANTSYYLMSQETAGGDQWYNYGPLTPSSVGTIVGATYVDNFNQYVTILPGQGFVPLNFLDAPPATSLSVSITSPAAAATISGSASITVSTTGPVTGLQVQVDGINQGGLVAVSVNQGPSYTLTLDTTTLSNGAHTLTVVASDAQSNTAPSAGVSVTVNNAPGGATPFIIGQSPVTLRNNYTGFVGMYFTVGSTPVVVTSLGRYVASGNSGSHILKLVTANSVDVPGGSVTVSLSGATPGQYKYATLPASVTLQASTSYFLVSQETLGGDMWYEVGPVSSTIVASVAAPAYSDGAGHFVPVGGYVGQSYVPVSFLYGPSANTLSATITSPQSGALLSGSSISVTVTTTGTVTSLQLQVDGVNQGSAASASPLTLNSTSLSNGQHTLTVIATGSGSSASSPGVTITVNNGGGSATALITAVVPSSLRNNYSGFVGLQINVGSSPLLVSSLGRIFVSGNTGAHLLKLAKADGTDVPGGSVSVSLGGQTPGQFVYGALTSPVALLANTTYFLLSQETAGGDMWYNLEPVTGTSVAQIAGPTYTDGGGHYVTVSGFPNYSYVPLSLQYQ